MKSMESENNIEILVKSSSGDPYIVSFYIDKNDISATCSCPAGIYRKLCKHITCLISGDDSILYDKNHKKIMEQIVYHLQRTTIPSLLCESNESEITLKKAQKQAKKAKKDLEEAVIKNGINK